MFRCSECGCEYKVKPDFCDCGNDIFEEFYETTPDEKPKREPVNKLELLSWIVFGGCLILSVLVLLFFPKIEEKPNTPEHEVKTVMEKPTYNIPDINSFWVDPQPVAEPEPQPVVEQIKEAVNVFIPKPETKKTTPKPVVKQTQKPVVKQNKTTPQPVKQQQTQTQQQTKPQTQQNQTKTTPAPKPRNSLYPLEIVNYRTALRQRLFSNLDIYKVEGHGKCGIQFAIDESGKLIKRGFIFQSDNKSVNDQVYKMLMRTPTFTPPPESYANKMIRMTFELDKETYIIKYID